MYRTQTGLLLTIDCEGKGAFEYTPEGVGVYWEPNGTGPAHYFQTLGLSLWLEQQGIPCIHANALAAGDEAIGIIAPSRTSKTTLTAALLESGLQMMTDDMMVLHRRGGEWIVYPGWPQFRMWSDTALQYSGSKLEALAKVHSRFEKRVVELEMTDRFEFCNQSRPLKQLYLLERRESEEGEITIQPIPPGEALAPPAAKQHPGRRLPATGNRTDQAKDPGRPAERYPAQPNQLPQRPTKPPGGL